MSAAGALAVDAGALLALDRVDAFYGETQVLFGVSLDVGRGEVVALLGANGAGKTTTLRAILGLTPARSGHIAFDGRSAGGPGATLDVVDDLGADGVRSGRPIILDLSAGLGNVEVHRG